MFTKWWITRLAMLVATSTAALGGKLTSDNYGVDGEGLRGYGYDNSAHHYRQSQLHSIQGGPRLSLLEKGIDAIRRTILRPPFDRQAPIGGFAAAIQGAAVPLAVAGLVAANREQIMEIINPSTTTTTTAAAAVDQCADISCTSPLSCDTDSGLCKCGPGGPLDCGLGGTSPTNLCILNTGCVCGTTTEGSCSATAKVAAGTPTCLKYTIATTADTLGTETSNASGGVRCMCIADSDCVSPANLCCKTGVEGVVEGNIGKCKTGTIGNTDCA